MVIMFFWVTVVIMEWIITMESRRVKWTRAFRPAHRLRRDAGMTVELEGLGLRLMRYWTRYPCTFSSRNPSSRIA